MEMLPCKSPQIFKLLHCPFMGLSVVLGLSLVSLTPGLLKIHFNFNELAYERWEKIV